MKLFQCPRCAGIVYFDNALCGACGERLAYDPANNSFVPADPDDAGTTNADVSQSPRRLCGNAKLGVCNWLAMADRSHGLCKACEHNHIIPDLTEDDRRQLWKQMEVAKHHLIYTLLRLDLPLPATSSDGVHGLRFDFPADPADGISAPVMTGHEDGIVTIDLAEADDATREARRSELREPYRTLLGHFRHEIGHYYWDLLVGSTGENGPFRAVFGDETRDYGEALREYYEHGAPADWPRSFVSAYASSHPFEDFAETWAHYLHMVDTLEMARAYGMRIDPPIAREDSHTAEVAFDPHEADSIEQLVSSWIPFTVAINSVNRCMGQPDLYPFVLNDAVIAKLGFIHGSIHRERRPPEDSLTPMEPSRAV